MRPTVSADGWDGTGYVSLFHNVPENPIERVAHRHQTFGSLSCVLHVVDVILDKMNVSMRDNLMDAASGAFRSIQMTARSDAVDYQLLTFSLITCKQSLRKGLSKSRSSLHACIGLFDFYTRILFSSLRIRSLRSLTAAIDTEA